MFQCRSDADIRVRLGKLPQDLDQSYDEIYENNTKNLGSTDKAHVDRAFMWVMCSAKPLKISELLGAVCLNITGTSDKKVTEKTLLDLCQHLLVYDSKLYRWRFPHTSVGEYFESHHWTLTKAHCYVAKVCLSQLLTQYDHFDPKSNVSDKIQYSEEISSIQEYIRWYWPIHVQAQEDEPPETLDPGLVSLFKSFLKSPMESSIQYQRWLVHLKRDNLPEPDGTTRLYELVALDDLWPSTVALFSMTCFSFTSYVTEWWEDSDVSVKNCNGLDLFALSGSVKVCELLLKGGLNPNQPIPRYGSALAAALRWERIEVAKFLACIAQVDVNMPLELGDYGGALVPAIRCGIDIVKFLVREAGADVNMPLQYGYYGGSALEVAVKNDIDIVKFLVQEAGADVDMQLEHGEYGSALAAAARYDIEMVRFLVQEAGADVNMQLEYGEYGSALVAAGHASDLDKARFLVQEAGADVNMPLEYGEYGSALAMAVRDNIEMVRFLVQEAGADVNMQLEYGEYGSALAVAVSCNEVNIGYNRIDIVRFLVQEAGADIDMQLKHGKYSSALAVAVESGYEEIVIFLKAWSKGSGQ